MDKQPVLMSHDGGLDDYLSVALLITMEGVDPVGIVVTDADCYVEPAVSATRKILGMVGKTDIPVASSTVKGVNPFPEVWRRDAYRIDSLPSLNRNCIRIAPLVNESGQEFVVRALRQVARPLTFLETGPLSTLAAALEIDPSIEDKVKEIVWMGGALQVPGNVGAESGFEVDGSMEWNVFWDPPAAERVWQTKIPITLCPLDITNLVPLTDAFMERLGRQREFLLSDLAFEAYEVVQNKAEYFFWDVLTTAYLGRPDLFGLGEYETEIVVEGASAGRTAVREGKRRILSMEAVDVEGFYAYVLEQWRSI